MSPHDLYENLNLHEEELQDIPPELAEERRQVRESVAKANEANECIKRANEQAKAWQEKCKKHKSGLSRQEAAEGGGSAGDRRAPGAEAAREVMFGCGP